jgi:4-amino-4-deoxy-L-arabinose transferase-like glycosyltransferase
MHRWLFVGIILLGFVLRIVGLAGHPAGFTPDEASYGYDAYSILKTGKDQWGRSLPLVFRSFGDDKLPAYVYLTVPSIAVFGLNEFSVRLPNAVLGTLAIIVVYFLVKELFKDERLALLSGFLLAISPWHIMLSRGAFEANLTSFFLPLAVLFFLRSFKNQRYLGLSFLIFLVNIFTYHTARILTPAILLFLIFNYRKELKLNRTFNISFIFAIVLFLISITGILVGGSRLASSSISDINFSDGRYLAQVLGEPSIVSKIFYNKSVYIFIFFIKNYFSYFSPQFLFTNGPAEGTYGMVLGVGVLYLVEMVFLIGFIAQFAKERSKEINLLVFWVLISPIPAALTKGPGYAANRVAYVIPALVILLALGANYIFKQKLWIYLYLIFLSLNFIYIGEKYLVGQTVNQASDMIYGMDQIVSNLQTQENKTIIISKSISEPQIYVAFYNKINPVDFQNASKNWNLVNGWVDQQGEYFLQKYVFRSINYYVDSKLPNTVLVGKPEDFPAEIKPDKVVNYPNLKPAYYIIKTK